LIDSLIDEPLIGVDSEWKSHNSFFKGPALLQLSSEKTVYLIDLLRLKNNKNLDITLARLFSNSKVVKVGFALSGDLAAFRQHLPEMTFYKTICNLCDI
jgi:ribonuclease D